MSCENDGDVLNTRGVAVNSVAVAGTMFLKKKNNHKKNIVIYIWNLIGKWTIQWKIFPWVIINKDNYNLKVIGETKRHTKEYNRVLLGGRSRR